MQAKLTHKHVTGNQFISDMCLVCGESNPYGLRTQFLALDDGSICAWFETSEAHQSYPGRVHGGIISAILDETIGRALQVLEPEVFGVTTELSVKFRAPVPLGQRLKVVARITKNGSRVYEGSGEIVLEDGTVAAQGTGKYLRLPPDQIAPGGLTPKLWHADPREHPSEIDA
jgi:uncharacterized protein (TIGR00369 family)